MKKLFSIALLLLSFFPVFAQHESNWAIKTDVLACLQAKGTLAVERKILPGFTAEIKGAYFHRKALLVPKNLEGNYFKAGLKYYLPGKKYARVAGSKANGMAGSYLRLEGGLLNFSGYSYRIEDVDYYGIIDGTVRHYDVNSGFVLACVGRQGYFSEHIVWDLWGGVGQSGIGADKTFNPDRMGYKHANNYAFWTPNGENGLAFSAGFSLGVAF